MPRLLILGASGQLARELLAAPGAFTAMALGRDRLDLSNLDQIAGAIAAHKPDAVINAAAYNAVDAAEANQADAFRLNRDAPGEAARACAELGIAFVHVSTDYVFDGAKRAPYVETDPCNPLSVYGRSKAEGERAVLAAGGAATVLRTSWVYAAHGGNFVRTMLALAQKNDLLRVVGDQIGRPTWAADLASAALRVAEGLRARDPGARGMMHFCNDGDCSRAEFAAAAIEGARRRGGPSARVEAIRTEDWPTPARRPADARLDCARYAAWAGAPPPHWRDSLERCLDQLYAIVP